jgi:hypothetical protein
VCVYDFTCLFSIMCSRDDYQEYEDKRLDFVEKLFSVGEQTKLQEPICFLY